MGYSRLEKSRDEQDFPAEYTPHRWGTVEPSGWQQEAQGPDGLSRLQPQPCSAVAGVAQSHGQGLAGATAGPLLPSDLARPQGCSVQPTECVQRKGSPRRFLEQVQGDGGS